MSGAHALIVDDEADIRELLEITLERMELRTTAVENLEQAYRAVGEETFDLCLTDMRLPDGNGIDLVRYMNRHQPAAPVAVITAHGSMDLAVEALKAGAFDFVSKPVELQGLRNLISAALRLRARQVEPRRALIGSCEAMQSVRQTIEKLARSQAPVWISGESGTGKELVARMIHERGPRAHGPFVPVNCGAIPGELMESELFGHKRGSFTGAVADKPGLFQAADGGTLFLDEVAELPLGMQVKLLRAIQEKAVRPVGAEREESVDARILSATHRRVDTLLNSGAFRQDLYYRLDVINVHVPALRERPGDIVELAEHLLGRLGAGAGRGPVELAAEALEALHAYDFPGNVRELENVLERALTMSEGERIGREDLGLPSTRTVARAMPQPLPQTSATPEEGLDHVLEVVEKQTIIAALEQVRWNKTAAARKLQISFGSLRYRMQKLGLD